MLKIHLTTAWRNFIKHKAFSIINVVGLAIGMACCLIIVFWVRDERSFDVFHQKASRIYRVVSDWEKYAWAGISGTPSPLGPAVAEQLPAVGKSARISWQNRKVFRYKEKAFYEDRGIIVDPSFFDIFSFPFLKGNWESAFRGPEDIVITETMAAKYFGSEDPIGKTFEVEGRPWIVRGVLKAIPRHSTLQFEYAHSFQFIKNLSGFAAGWNAFNFGTFLLLNEGEDARTMGPKITEIGRRNECAQVKEGARFRLQPFRDVHLDAQSSSPAGLELGDSKTVLLFSVIAVFVLAVACINFMNLSTARSGLRAKEVGLKKVVGATRGQIIRQFYGESLGLVAAAAVAALILVRLLLPAFNRVSGKALSLNLLQPEYLIGAAVIVLVTGLIAGFYPALVLSSFQPVRALKGDIHSGRRGAAFRKGLVIFQFSLSIILLVTTFAVVRQFHFMRTAPLGFNKDNVVQIPIKENIGKSYETVKARLQQNPVILAVTGQSYSFAETTWRSSGNFEWEGRPPERRLDMIYTGVDPDYFKAMEIGIVNGRAFSKEHPTDARDAFILNEQAIREMGIQNPVGKRFAVSKTRQGTIIGVVRDVRFRSFHHKVEPNVFYLADPTEDADSGLLMIRINDAKTPEALAHIRKVWEEINPVSPFEYRFLDETYERLYRAERRMTGVFTVFSGLAVFIACLGLMGLAAFMAERRTREIGIRKILGASSRGILVLISSRLTKWILAANLFAWPAAYLVMSKLLQAYAYRFSADIFLFVGPSAAVFALAVLTVSLQSMRTAGTDPVKALRTL